MYFQILAQGGESNALPNTEITTLHSNGSLEIKEISKEHEGFYQCVISNGVGSDLKRDINIKVIGKFHEFTRLYNGIVVKKKFSNSLINHCFHLVNIKSL